MKNGFCLSTARLSDTKVLQVRLPFASKVVDELSKMRREGGSIKNIAEKLNIADSQTELFNTFFTADLPPCYKSYSGPNVRLRYFGHACILIETAEMSILVDPLISYYGCDSTVDHFSDMDLPETIDYVLITHNHQDHILFETLLPLRHKIGNIVVPRTSSGALQDPSLKLMFNAIGFDNVIELGEMESLECNNCIISAIPFIGEHSDLDIKAKACYHVSIGEFTSLFMADSRVLEPRLYEHIHAIIGKVDVMFLGMECDGAPLSWLYGPLLTTTLERDKDQSRRLSGSDFNKGVELVKIFKPKELYVYAMGQEPWLEFISSIKYTDESNPIIQSDLLIESCKENGITAQRLFGEKELLYNINN